MVDIVNCDIKHVSIHTVGNLVDDSLYLSKQELDVSDNLIRELLVRYFIYPFKSNEYYNLVHETDLNLNEVFVYVSKIFDNPEELHEQSVNLAKHLYEQSTHPKIKSGEFYTVYF